MENLWGRTGTNDLTDFRAGPLEAKKLTVNRGARTERVSKRLDQRGFPVIGVLLGAIDGPVDD